MLENTYSVTSDPRKTIIRGRSLQEFHKLIGNECVEMLQFMEQHGTIINERNGLVEIIIPRDCVVSADSIISKIYHAKRVNRTQQDKMWRGAI